MTTAPCDDALGFQTPTPVNTSGSHSNPSGGTAPQEQSVHAPYADTRCASTSETSGSPPLSHRSPVIKDGPPDLTGLPPLPARGEGSCVSHTSRVEPSARSRTSQRTRNRSRRSPGDSGSTDIVGADRPPERKRSKSASQKRTRLDRRVSSGVSSGSDIQRRPPHPAELLPYASQISPMLLPIHDTTRETAVVALSSHEEQRPVPVGGPASYGTELQSQIVSSHAAPLAQARALSAPALSEAIVPSFRRPDDQADAPHEPANGERGSYHHGVMMVGSEPEVDRLEETLGNIIDEEDRDSEESFCNQ